MYTGLVKDVATTTPTSSLRMDWGQGGSTGTATDLVDATLNPLMTLRFSGQLGIGTTSPSHLLNVKATSGDAEVHIQAQGNDGGDAILYFNGSSTNQRKCAIISSNVAPNSYCKQDLHFCMETTEDLSDVDITDSKMVLTNAGNVGIGTASSRGNLSLGSATVVKTWNAFNNNSSAGNYTFPRNCVALVHFHYAGGQDLNISAVYRITMAYAGNPTIEVLYSGSYVNATVGHGAHVVRFYGQNLPAAYNSANYQLRISQISYSGSY
jgi:hypothetical protein